VRTVVWYANRTSEVKELLEGWESIIQFDIKGEKPFHVICKDNKVKLVAGKHEKPDVSIQTDSDTFYKMIITNEIDPDEAFQSKKYQVYGTVVDAIKFRRLGEMVLNSHRMTFSFLKKFSFLL